MKKIDTLSGLEGRALLNKIFKEIRYEKQASGASALFTCWRLCTYESELFRYSKSRKTLQVNGVEVSLATALAEKMHQQAEQTIYQLTADNYEQLTDSPFEIAEQDEFWFDVKSGENTIAHRFVISGVHHSDLERLETDLSKICQSYVDWLVIRRLMIICL